MISGVAAHEPYLEQEELLRRIRGVDDLDGVAVRHFEGLEGVIKRL